MQSREHFQYNSFRLNFGPFEGFSLLEKFRCFPLPYCLYIFFFEIEMYVQRTKLSHNNTLDLRKTTKRESVLDWESIKSIPRYGLSSFSRWTKGILHCWTVQHVLIHIGA